MAAWAPAASSSGTRLIDTVLTPSRERVIKRTLIKQKLPDLDEE
jgi:hypothetical protein